jgi:hypothetical protein
MNPAPFNPDKHTIFTPINEEKYVGKGPVCARSTWETAMMKWLDSNPSVLKWSSECLEIPYYDVVKKKNRRYFPDFTMVVKDVDGKESTWVIEIKPYKETISPIRGKKKERTFLYELLTYQTNIAKWQAAALFCKKYGANFKIITEHQLFNNKG